MYDVKIEDGGGICRGCLSSNRSLSSLANCDLYFTLLNEKEKITENPVVQVCWECAAIMRRMRRFQLQVLKANYLLAESLEMSLVNGPLSQLAVCYKQEYDVVIKESNDTLGDKLELYDSEIKEEKSDYVEFNEQQHNDINDYNSETDGAGVCEDDNLESKLDQSSDEETREIENKRNKIWTRNKHVNVKKRKQEYEKVCAIPIIPMEIKNDDQSSTRRSTRIIENSIKLTHKAICKTNIKHKYISKKKKTKTTKLINKRKSKIDSALAETNTTKNIDIEFVTDHIEVPDLNKLDEDEVFKEKPTNGHTHSEGKNEKNIEIQDKSDEESNDRKDSNISDKSQYSHSDDTNGSDFSDTLRPKVKPKIRKIYKQRKKMKSLQTVRVDYTCAELDKYFNKVKVSDDLIQEVLKSEPRYVTEERPYGCEFCGLCFELHRHLTHHIHQRHKQVRKAMRCTDPDSPNRYRYSMYSCTICEKVLRVEHTDAHMKYMHRFNYVCIECNKIFWEKAAGEEHCSTSHNQFVCRICNVIKKKRKYLDKHMETWHLPCACAECGREFPTRRELRRHRDARHPADSNPELRYCVQCDVQFRSVFAYQSHLRYTKTHKEKPDQGFPCSVCGKVLMTKYAVECHHDRFHKGTTRFQCPHCGKFFARKSGMKSHIESTHLKVVKPKDKICSYCGRAFTTNRILIHHIRTHTGERPHACAHCPAAFAQPFPLQKHVATVHKHASQTAQNTELSSQSSFVPSENDFT